MKDIRYIYKVSRFKGNEPLSFMYIPLDKDDRKFNRKFLMDTYFDYKAFEQYGKSLDCSKLERDKWDLETLYQNCLYKIQKRYLAEFLAFKTKEIKIAKEFSINKNIVIHIDAFTPNNALKDLKQRKNGLLQGIYHALENIINEEINKNKGENE